MAHNPNTTGKSQRDYLNLDNRSSCMAITNLRSTTQSWKRNDVSPSDKKPRLLSTGGSVAFILALAVGIAFIVLVAVFVIFRKRYGPKYTVLCFVTGKCPKADRRARASTVPTSIESGIPRETLPSLDRGSKRSKPRVSTCVTGTNKPRMSSQTSQFSHGRQPAVIDPNRPSAPPRDTHPRTQMETANKEIGNTSCRKPPPAALPSLHKSDLRAATEQLRALAPTSPCSSRFTISTQSSDPLPSIYRMALGSRSHKRNSSSNTNCWSYNHDVRSAVDSEDRVLSLPSPSPMLRNMLRPSPKPQTLQPHVYRQMQQPCDTRECECDVALHILPRSAFAVDDTALYE